MPYPELLPGDVFLTRSPSLLGKLIRWFSRQPGEAPTRYNHVGLIVSRGPITKARSIEALLKVRHGRFFRYYAGDKSEVAIYRMPHIFAHERRSVVQKAMTYQGHKYGIQKLLVHALRKCMPPCIVSRLLFIDRQPICSWLVAHSYRTIGVEFGVPPDAAQPDDIDDWIQKSSAWVEILPPQQIRSWRG